MRGKAQRFPEWKGKFWGISCAGIVLYLVSSPRFRGMTAEDAKRFMKGIMHAGERYEQL